MDNKNKSNYNTGSASRLLLVCGIEYATKAVINSRDSLDIPTGYITRVCFLLETHACMEGESKNEQVN